MARRAGTPKTGGREKGTPNKVSATVKAMVLEALDKAGGIEYLLAQSEANPTAFLSLIGRILPTQVEGTGEEGEHKFVVTWLK